MSRLAGGVAVLVALSALQLGGRVEVRADAPAVATKTTTDDAARALDEKVLATAKNGSEIMANLTYLCDDIGPRLTGSAALKRANEWAAEKMKSYGLSNVHLEAWSVPVGWERGTATAQIIEPNDGCRLAVAALGWSPGTKGKIEGDVVVVKATNSKELAAYKGKLKNAIILRGPPSEVAPISEKGFMFEMRPRRPRPAGAPRTDNGASPAGGRNAAGAPNDMNRENMFRQMMAFRREMTEFLRNEGAAAVFMDAAKPQGLLNMTGSWQGSDRASAGDPIPGLFIAHEHYALLYRLATRPAPARTRVALDVTNKFIPGPVAVYNTIGEIPGSEKPNEFVVIGGHLDSWDLGQGATDNGTGSAVVLEAARILAKCGTRPKRTIRCILFTGEEQGMRGSHAYVTQHKDDMARTSMCVVHDLGTGKVEGIGLMGHTDLAPILERELISLKPLGVTQFPPTRMGGSDHAPFDQAGVPGFYFIQDPAEYRLTHHSQSDTLDKAKEPDLVQGAQVMATLAMRVANMPSLLPREKKEERRRGSETRPGG